jgi:hypothetical protein
LSLLVSSELQDRFSPQLAAIEIDELGGVYLRNLGSNLPDDVILQRGNRRTVIPPNSVALLTSSDLIHLAGGLSMRWDKLLDLMSLEADVSDFQETPSSAPTSSSSASHSHSHSSSLNNTNSLSLSAASSPPFGGESLQSDPSEFEFTFSPSSSPTSRAVETSTQKVRL